MRPEEILEAIGNTDEVLLERSEKEKKKRRRFNTSIVMKIGGVCAAACLLFVIGYGMVSMLRMGAASMAPTEGEMPREEAMETAEAVEEVAEEMMPEDTDEAEAVCEYAWGIAGKAETALIEDYGVTLKISEADQIPYTGALFILENTTEHTVTYGDEYRIQILVEGEWHEISVLAEWNTIAWILEAGETVNLDLNWEHIYGALPIGTYRVVKDVAITEEDMEDVIISIGCEFEIK